MLCPKISLELGKAFRSFGWVARKPSGKFLPNHILKLWFIWELCLYSTARNRRGGDFQVRIQPGDIPSSHSDHDFRSDAVQCGRTLVPPITDIRFSSPVLKAAQRTMMQLDQDTKNPLSFSLLPLSRQTNKFYFPLLLTFFERSSLALLHAPASLTDWNDLSEQLEIQ